jgi:hypothetical protein
VKKQLIVVVATTGLAIGLLSGCGNSQPALTKEQVQAIDQLKQMQDQTKANQVIQAEKAKALQTMFDKATNKPTVVTGIDGIKHQATEYTITNDSKFDFSAIQIQWVEYDASGNVVNKYGCADSVQDIKAGKTFTTTVRGDADTDTFKEIKLVEVTA